MASHMPSMHDRHSKRDAGLEIPCIFTAESALIGTLKMLLYGSLL